MEENKNKKNIRNKNPLLIALALVLLLDFGLLAVFFKIRSSERIEGAGSSVHAPVTKISYNGRERTVRRNLRTLLVLGTDKYLEDMKTNGPELYFNYEQCDFVTVLVFDTAEKTCTPLQLNRETMCDVYRLSINGMVYDTMEMQLCLAHTYGSGGEDSCENVLNTVRDNIIFGAPIDSYMTFTMDSVPDITDMVGGVEVTIEDELAASIDPSFEIGKTVTLKDDMALSFVRVRSNEYLEGNVERMNRQRQYLEGFTVAARKAAEADADLASTAVNSLTPYITTNLSIPEMCDVVNRLAEYEIKPVVTPEGTLAQGKYAEFHIDNDSLWNLVTELWC